MRVVSARDLARFALLYLNKGRWQDRQIISAAWVEESTRACSHSDFGPGCYLWWTGPISNGVAPAVNLPDGSFYAAGIGGQLAFVIPAHDFIVVHRGPHVEGGLANLRTFGRLLWLILDAGKFPDIGPDASFEAAQGMRAYGDTLSRMLPGKTLLYGDAAPGGPHRVRLNADGTAAALRGSEPAEFDTGIWSIREDKFCREWKKTEPRQMCMAAVSAGSKTQLFDSMGLMWIEVSLTNDVRCQDRVSSPGCCRADVTGRRGFKAS